MKEKRTGKGKDDDMDKSRRRQESLITIRVQSRFKGHVTIHTLTRLTAQVYGIHDKVPISTHPSVPSDLRVCLSGMA